MKLLCISKDYLLEGSERGGGGLNPISQPLDQIPVPVLQLKRNRRAGPILPLQDPLT